MLWRVSEEIILIDLGFYYYIIKFYKEKNLQKKTLQQRPWFMKAFFCRSRDDIPIRSL